MDSLGRCRKPAPPATTAWRGRPAVNYLLAGVVVDVLFAFFVFFVFLVFLVFLVVAVVGCVEDPWAAESVVMANGSARTPAINSIANFFIVPPD